MSIADVKYKDLIRKVIMRGVWDDDGDVRPVYKDGTPAYSLSIFGEQIKFEKGEVPIITSKKVPVQSSINEVVHAFFRLNTNKVTDFEELGIGYWREWALEDGTIGHSYGKQLSGQVSLQKFANRDEFVHMNQVEYILHELEHNPYSRRIMFSYWNFSDDHIKALKECVYTGQFNVRRNDESGKLQLDMVLIQRSVDTLLGLPSNWAGYYALQCALANLFDYEVGTFTHQMGNIHLYDNQIELAIEMLKEPEHKQSSIWVNPDVNNFYDYTVNDIKIVDYEHGKSFRSEVAI